MRELLPSAIDFVPLQLMAANSTPRSGNGGGGAKKTCQFKLVLLGESAVGKRFPVSLVPF